MRIDFESTHYLEVIGYNGAYRDLPIVIGLECTTRSQAPTFDPTHGGDPGSAPEFDISYLAFTDEAGDQHEMTFQMMRNLLSWEVLESLTDMAEEEAIESGEF